MIVNEERNCKWKLCQKKFLAKLDTHLYCSTACRMASHNEKWRRYRYVTCYHCEHTIDLTQVKEKY
jgi:hypothetical protein